MMTLVGFACALALSVSTAGAGELNLSAVFEGPAPRTLPIDMGQDKVCIEHHKDAAPPVNEMLVLGENQALANVLFEVVGGLPEGADYPVPADPVVLTQEGCRYVPHVFAVRAGQTLKVRNPDGTLHNVHAQPKVNDAFNRGMPANVTEFEVVFDKPEPLFQIRCNVHPWMLAYCAVLDHPFYGVSDLSGAATIAELPPGEYEVRATHEVLGQQTAKVTVAEGQAADLKFSFTRPSGRK